MSNATAPARAALKLSSILVPVDFSDRCRHAAECASALARRFDAEIVLMHAAAPPQLAFAATEALAYAPTPEFTAQDVAERAAQLDAFCDVETPHRVARRVVVDGDPARAIVEFAAERRCDLIVMPTHGYGALRRLVAGSVTAQVVRDAPCPVWTGPHYEDQPPSRYETVVCALDLERESRDVLTWAAGFARACNSTLEVVHAIPLSTVRLGGLYFDPEWHIAVARDARERIEWMLHDIGASADVSIQLGDVPEVVVAKAKEVGAGLVVIGRGPHSYSIIRESFCPIVAV